MRPIGILGGMGPEATAAFYLEVIRGCQRRYNAQNDSDYPSLVLFNVPVPDMLDGFGGRDETIRLLVRAGQAAEAYGASCLAMPCCTAHVLEAGLRRHFQVPFVSIVEEVVRDVGRVGAKRVGVLGTRATLESGLFRTPLEERGVEPLAHPDQDAVTGMIRRVMAGQKARSDRLQLLALVSWFEQEGADAVILGCTELPLLWQDGVHKCAVLNPLRILAETVLDHATRELERVGEETGPDVLVGVGASELPGSSVNII